MPYKKPFNRFPNDVQKIDGTYANAANILIPKRFVKKSATSDRSDGFLRERWPMLPPDDFPELDKDGRGTQALGEAANKSNRQAPAYFKTMVSW